MKKYLMEGIGAFFFTLAVVMAAALDKGQMAPLIAGGMLLALYYSGAPISGAHYNPAVSLAELIRGKLDRVDFSYYWVAQFAGSSIAAIMAVFLLRCSGNGDFPVRQYDSICALIAEFLGAFVLVFTFLQVNSPLVVTGNASAGLALGFIYFGSAFVFAPLSGGYFNPALFVGACLAGLADWSDILIYLAGGLLGAAAAVSVFRIVNND